MRCVCEPLEALPNCDNTTVCFVTEVVVYFRWCIAAHPLSVSANEHRSRSLMMMEKSEGFYVQNFVIYRHIVLIASIWAVLVVKCTLDTAYNTGILISRLSIQSELHIIEQWMLLARIDRGKFIF